MMRSGQNHSAQWEIDDGPHGNKEETEQEPFEGLDITLQFVPVFALCQHNPSQKCSQCGRQPHRPHGQGDTDEEKQGKGGEDLALDCAGDEAEHGARQQSVSEVRFSR